MIIWRYIRKVVTGDPDSITKGSVVSTINRKEKVFIAQLQNQEIRICE